MRNANLNNGFSGGPSELRPNKQLRVDGVVVGGVGVKHHQQVDQEKLKKAFLHFAKLINENANQKKSYLEDGKQGRLQCIACGRFGRKDLADCYCLLVITYKLVFLEFVYRIGR